MDSPWPRAAALAVAVALVAGIVGYRLGRPTAPDASSVEVGFLFDMIAHHEQALELSNLELELGATKTVPRFAREILLFQSHEIGLMERRLEDWGYLRDTRPDEDTAMAWMGDPTPIDEMPGLATQDEIDALSEATGTDVDALWVRLMQDHHWGGVHMAEAAAAEAEDQWVVELAERMARIQRGEIHEMEISRKNTGLPDNPTGWKPDPIRARMESATGSHESHD